MPARARGVSSQQCQMRGNECDKEPTEAGAYDEGVYIEVLCVGPRGITVDHAVVSQLRVKLLCYRPHR